MNVTKWVVSSALASAVLLGSNAAQAACSTYGQVEQYMTDGTTCYAWVSPANSLHRHAYEYYFASTNASLCNAVFNAKHQTGWISGSAASCPTTGTLRYGGTISRIYAQ